MNNDITGKLHAKFETKQITDTFKKRDFVVEYYENPAFKPQYLSFQLVQDKCELIDAVQIGQTLTVHFNLRGREWNSPDGETKYFNSLEAWRVVLAQQTTAPQTAQTTNEPF